MTERILIWDEIDPKLAATSVQTQDLFGGDRSPGFPHRLVIPICKRVVGVELELIDLEIGEVLDQFQECDEIRKAATRVIEHDRSIAKVREISNNNNRR